jgi:hypothetical protein
VGIPVKKSHIFPLWVRNAGKRREAYTFCHHCPSSKLKASKHIYDYNIQNTTYPLKPSYTILLLEVWSVENRCRFSFSSYFDQENLFVMVWKMWKSAFTKLAISRYFWWRIIFFLNPKWFWCHKIN